MEISLEQLLAGKSTKIKNANYLSTPQYVEPFLNKMQKFTNDFRVQVKLPDQITTNKEGDLITDDITYNRVYIQAVLPEQYRVDNHDEVVGMVYGLDVRKPVVKLFKGALNCACTNLCVFNPGALDVQELQPNAVINYAPLSRIIEMTNDAMEYVQRLKNTEFVCTERNINETLGKWVRHLLTYNYDSGFGKVKLATSTAIDAYKLLFEKGDSPYIIPAGENSTMFNVYNAFTQIITDNREKEIVNECEKTLLLKSILDI